MSRYSLRDSRYWQLPILAIAAAALRRSQVVSSESSSSDAQSEKSNGFVCLMTTAHGHKAMMDQLAKSLREKDIKVTQQCALEQKNPRLHRSEVGDISVIGRWSGTEPPFAVDQSGSDHKGEHWLLSDFFYQPPLSSLQRLECQFKKTPLTFKGLFTPTVTAMVTKETREAGIADNQVIPYGLPPHIKPIEPYSHSQYSSLIKWLNIPQESTLLLFSGTTLPRSAHEEWADVRFLRSLLSSMSTYYQDNYPVVVISLHPGRTDYDDYFKHLLNVLEEFPYISVRIPINKKLSEKIALSGSSLESECVISSEEHQLNHLLPLAHGVAQAVPGACINQACISKVPTLIDGENAPVKPILPEVGCNPRSFLHEITQFSQQQNVHKSVEDPKTFDSDSLAEEIIRRMKR